jgi:hypothetical protein
VRQSIVVVLAACLVTVAAAPSAHGRSTQSRPWVAASDDGSTAPALRAEEPAPTGLPPAAENLELVGELSPQHFGRLRNGEIADLAVHKGYAYLNSWDSTACNRGGVYVVDIRDPAHPEEVSYIPPIQPFYHGEGAHAISMDTPQFKGDLLAVNDETWGSNLANTCGPPDLTGGGFDLYDVTDPTHPKVLVQGAGDRDAGTPDDTSDDTARGNSFHSVFVWQAGPRAYLVASDNIELTDVDIFDITDPKHPVQVGDFDLAEMFPQILDGEQSNGGAVFNHDMIVKKIGDRYRLLASYWDAGYVQLDVTDPAHPVYVTDTTFSAEDPLFPGSGLTPEGNAHEAEFSFDNQFFLAADEDFAPFRAGAFTIDGAEFPAAGVSGGASAASLPDHTLNGPTYYGGYGCNESAPIPTRASINPVLAPGEEAIIVLQRGPVDDPAAPDPEVACFPGEKARNAIAAGWDAVLLTNRHLGSEDLDEPYCGAGDFEDQVIVTLCTTHAGFHEIFGITDDDFSLPVPEGHHPALGTAGKKVRGESELDGWGYAHLYDAKTSELLDSYAIPEALDPRFAFGFGDLTIHEFATDPTEPLAYAAYYGGGMRVFRFSRADGLVPTGKFIDDDGNGSNFWGVEQFTGSDGERYIAGSDRDFGLQIFRYTGPGAARPPACADIEATAAFDTPVEIPLTCTDPNSGNVLTLSIAGPPQHGTLGAITGGRVVYTPAPGFGGDDAFSYRANDGAADSGPARVAVKVLEQGEAPPPVAIRIRPGLAASLLPKSDPTKPFRFRVAGRLKLPKGILRGAGCDGTVVITARSGGRRLARRTTDVGGYCHFAERVRLHRAGDGGRVRFTVSFRGNKVLLPQTVRRSAPYGTEA